LALLPTKCIYPFRPNVLKKGNLAKSLRTLQKIRSNPDQAPLGRVLIPFKSKTKELVTNVTSSLVGQVMGQGTNPYVPNLCICVYTMKKRLNKSESI